MIKNDAKGIKKKIGHQVTRYFVSLWQCVPPVMDVSRIHDWMHDRFCKIMTGGLILINKPRGGSLSIRLEEDKLTGTRAPSSLDAPAL